ncbi:hypothetical protein HBI04_011100 [Parastagonospora nodorum]|nr:hypothetical protein HBH42_037890 [Parastagonospora nodorum]KAH4274466.1 hypothetical protein HBI03_008920 [Parastagonospora nodorum]KAH4284436.1 hypothetical protein HBI04_011100 [Parastagonospora nodorum]KAH5252797.1 hypothetical protein HBI71_146470 [Parastagonospora nodorum]KAH5371717.1 hypothetical protein HBI48_029670 [Parastagonospora nodorum]
MALSPLSELGRPAIQVGCQPVLPAVKSEGRPRKDHSEPSLQRRIDTDFLAQGRERYAVFPSHLHGACMLIAELRNPISPHCPTC